MQDENGMTPLHLVLHANWKGGKIPVSTIALLMSNNNVNVQDKDGMTPLHLALCQAVDMQSP